MINTNRKNYEFDEKKYPILSDKSIRNHITHIFQRDSELIKTESYFGTFNTIHPNLKEQTRLGLLSENNKQNNLLNLETMKYLVVKIKNNDLVKYELDIIETEKELEELKVISNYRWENYNMLKLLSKE